ncbi:beta strand repeat-containing protein [Thiomicrorhabdus indica]|uniref:beta strand repeat-containing protein n=1 Tax=Thiomicrorhabdus indica TaxID=2267253 RepID=UPI00102DFE6B|nr:hypothetical protein [Thiomicrorhabdus indica]
MAFTSNDILNVTLGIFDMPAGGYWLNNFTNYATNVQNEWGLTDDETMAELARALVKSPQYQESIEGLDNLGLAQKILSSFGLEDNLDMLLATEAAVAAFDPSNIDGEIAALIWGYTKGLTQDADVMAAYPDAAATLANKLAVAVEVSVTNPIATTDMAALQGLVEGVGPDSTNVDVDTTFMLTIDQDDMSGTNNADMFLGYIFDNQNTLQSGDMIDGAGGVDRLEADIGNSQAFAITPHTESVEQFAVRAQDDNVADDSSDNNMNNNVQIDAERMEGTNWYESNNSRADVVIEDVRIERTEAYNDSSNQITKDITIAMVSTDSGDVDLDVYFDNHSLVKEGDNSSNSITMTVGNQVEIADFDATAPLKDLPYTDVSFQVNSTTVTLDLAANGVADVETYADMWQVMQDAFAEAQAKAEYSELLEDVVLTLSPGTDTFFSRDGVARSADEYVLTISDGEIGLNNPGWTADEGLPSNNAFSANVAVGDTTVTSNLITSTVVLDDVGRGSMGGDLVIGAMSTGETSDSTGVEQFDIYVDRNSELQNITSTANTLEEVYVYNRDHFADNNTTANGSLTVTGIVDGNDGGANGVGDIDDEDGVAGTIDQYGFNDVRVLDASAMEGAVNFTAVLSEAVVGKYLDLTDTATNAGADNRTFDYDLGTNDDTLRLDIDRDNLQSAGTATREDFNLAVDGNNGDDSITVRIGQFTRDEGRDADDDSAFGIAANWDEGANWYENLEENANISINGGAGNDHIMTTGVGDAVIDAGADNDTVYTDNSGLNNAGARINEVQTLTFTAASVDGLTDVDTLVTFTVDGVAVTVAQGDTAANVATKVAAALNNTANFTNADGGSATAVGDTVVFTFDNAAVDAAFATNGDIAPIVVEESYDTEAAAAAVETTAGVPNADVAAEAEVTTITFTPGTNSAIGSTVTFDGTTVTLADTDGNGTVSIDELVEQFAGATYANHTVTDYDFSAGTVQVTNNTAAAQVDLDDTSIAGTAAGAADGVTGFAVDNQGVDAVTNADTAEVQTFTMGAADETGTLYVNLDTDGTVGLAATDTTVAVSLDDNDSAIEVASKVAAAINAQAGTVVTADATAADGTLTVTWDNPTDTFANVALSTFADGPLQGATTITETTKGEISSNGNAATWVVNTEANAAGNHVITDLDSLGTGANALLYGAQLTVTYSGAQVAGASGVISGDAVATDNGFESTVTVGTTNAIGNATNINQAIKDALTTTDNVAGGVAGDDVLEELLSVQDGPANSIIITSAIDGRFQESDLAITIQAATFTNLSAAEQSAIIGALRDIDNDSTATYTDTEVQNRLDQAVEVYTTGGALDALDMAVDAGGALLAGNTSLAVSDNMITLGSGDDVVVLGTDFESNDMLVYTGSGNGTDTVVNFVQTGDAADSINFEAYLNASTSASGSSASAVTPTITLNADTTADINEVTIINDFAQSVGETWAGLNENNLVAALNDAGTEDWGSIDETDLDAANIANLTSGTYNHIVMVENDLNDGQYKVFNLVAENNGDFTGAQLVGIIDFGNTLDAVTSANFDGTLFV